MQSNSSKHETLNTANKTISHTLSTMILPSADDEDNNS